MTKLFFCDSCRHVVALDEAAVTCPHCGQPIDRSTVSYASRPHDDGFDVLIPLALLDVFTGREPVYASEESAPEEKVEGAGGEFGGAGASVDVDEKSAGSEEATSVETTEAT